MIKNLFLSINLCLISFCYGAQQAPNHLTNKRTSIKDAPTFKPQSCADAFAWFAQTHKMAQGPCSAPALPHTFEAPKTLHNTCGNLVLPCVHRISISQNAPSPSPIEVNVLGIDSATPATPSPLQQKP